MTPEQLEQAWAAGRIVPLGEAPDVPHGLADAHGPGVVVGSGGSLGGRRWCLQPLAHLQASASATGAWLQQQGLDPAGCLHLNPLPLDHVSGLLPLVRCRQWGARYRRLAPELMRDGAAVAAAEPPAALAAQGPVLLSLVPTQLSRLLTHPAGVAWLQQLAVIWVGGAPLPADLASRARQLGLRLAPCYGSTETAAMVCALPPSRFLAGESGCGEPLADVSLRVDGASGAIEIAAERLSPGWLQQNRLVPLPRTADGWWRSGDAAQISPAGLQILGRLDGAIHSGGETVFPEQVEQRLRALIQAADMPVAELLLLAQPDPEWGERLVALVRWHQGADGPQTLAGLAQLARQLPPAQRPRRWQPCPQLAPGLLGKWERQRWGHWLQIEAADRG